MGHLSYQCDKLLENKEIVTFLQRERYDVIILDAFNPCSFILARKLGTVMSSNTTFASHYMIPQRLSADGINLNTFMFS